MGVLMSKKQQVERVQKCNTVISAFKEGLQNRPAQPSCAATPAWGMARGADSTSQPRRTKEGEEEQAEPKEKEDMKPRPTTGQKQTTVLPKEAGKANQETWSRLRDGKGAEPDEIDRMNQPAFSTFVRPKRDVNDDQSFEIILNQREQPANEEMCEICEVWTAEDLYPCRTCCRVFHDGCLREMGYLHTAALQEMRESAHTATGWSCHYCDNVDLLLTEEEMYSLMDTFKRCKIIPESCLSSDDFLHYKRQQKTDLTDEQEEEVLVQFSALDPEKKGSIEWADFLSHESLELLRKLRTANSLVRLLTVKERDRARAMFTSLDQDTDGLVTWREVQRAQQSWFLKHSKDSQSCNVRLARLCSPVVNLSISHVGPISERSPANSIGGRSQEKAPITSGKEDNRPVSWVEFLKESAVYILAARPNSCAVHLCPPL